MSADEKQLDPEQEKTLARIRRIMAIALATTFIAIAVVLGLIGYKVYRSGDTAVTAASAGAEASLPPGARVLSSAIGDRRLVLTVEIGGVVELRSFDLETLRPIARQRLESKP
jgi:hypothetical protein